LLLRNEVTGGSGDPRTYGAWLCYNVITSRSSCRKNTEGAAAVSSRCLLIPPPPATKASALVGQACALVAPGCALRLGTGRLPGNLRVHICPAFVETDRRTRRFAPRRRRRPLEAMKSVSFGTPSIGYATKRRRLNSEPNANKQNRPPGE
jgi:hypothetical protein